MPPDAEHDPGDKHLAKRIGARVRGHRLKCGVTLKTLAEKVDCSRSLLSKLENGKALPSLTTIIRLARALGTTVGLLVD